MSRRWTLLLTLLIALLLVAAMPLLLAPPPATTPTGDRFADPATPAAVPELARA